MWKRISTPEWSKQRVSPFDWSDTTAAVLLERWDLLLGSDLIYNRETVRLLPPVLATLIRTGSKAVYCRTLDRWGAFGRDLPFYKALGAHGLRCSVLAGSSPSCTSPPRVPAQMCRRGPNAASRALRRGRAT